MKSIRTITPLALAIAVLSIGAAALGIFTSDGPGAYTFTSIHGQSVMIWGKGIYQHMSAEVAPQGMAQDVVSLFIGVPLLLISLWMARKGLRKGQILLTGTMGYFLVTYIFYMLMASYNQLFLLYVVLASLSFFTFTLCMLSFPIRKVRYYYADTLPVKLTGGYLMISAVAIGSLWLSRVLVPLLNGSTYPEELQHYTTLVVQGLDLAILLPAAFISGCLLIRKSVFGYLLAPVYAVFLSLMMTALTAKVVGMALLGTAVGLPVMIIIPGFNIGAVVCTLLVLNSCIENGDKPVSTTISSVQQKMTEPHTYILTD